MSDRTYTLIEDMVALEGESWQELCRRHKVVNRGLVSPNKPALRFRKSFDSGYRHDLAEGRNDPAAFVTGPHSLNRLIEKRKRQGWIVGKPGSAADVDVNTLQEKNPERDLFAESLREAKEICGE